MWNKLGQLHRRLIFSRYDLGAADPADVAKVWHLYNVWLVLFLMSALFLVRAVDLEVYPRIVVLGVSLMCSGIFLWFNPKRLGGRWVAQLAVCVLAGLVVMGILTNGGIQAGVMTYSILPPMVAGMLLGRRHAVAWTVLVVVFISGLSYAQNHGVVVPNLSPEEAQRSQFLLQRYMFPFIVLAIIVAYLRSTEIADARYQQSIAELTEEVVHRQRAEHEAMEASAVKSQFLANMSHELRTPLNAILGFSQLLKDRVTDDQGRLYLSKVEYSGKLLLEVVNDVLNFAQLEEGRVNLSQQDFSLSEVLQNVIDMLAPKAAEKHLDLRVEWPSMEHDLTGDPLRLGQVLIHLIGNALKFTDKGHVRFAVQAMEGETSDRTRLQFSVQDTGIGIHPDQLSEIFKPFKQGDDGMTRRFGGVGLGLSVAKRLIEQMDGVLSVESQPNQGAVFKFSLEFGHAADMTPHHRQYDEERYRLFSLRDRAVVAVYGSTPKVAQTLVSALGLHRWEVMACGNVDAVIEVLHNHERVDLLLVAQTVAPSDAIAEKLRQHEDLLQQRVTHAVAGELWAKALPNLALTQVSDPLNPSVVLHLLIELFEQQRVETKEGDQPLGNYRVLIAEDNRVNQELARAMLERFGAEVVIVSNGQQVLTLLQKQEHFDAVLMDIQMPVMDGLQATRLIRERHEWSRLPIVAVTAHVLEEDVNDCFEAGMNAYLPKPFKAKQLLATLLEVIEGH